MIFLCALGNWALLIWPVVGGLILFNVGGNRVAELREGFYFG